MKPIEDRLYISTSCLDGEKDIEISLSRLNSMNITHVELSGIHPYIPFSKLTDRLLYWRDAGMRFTIHNYFPRARDSFVLNFISTSKVIRDKSRQHIFNAVKLAYQTGSTLYGFHPGYLYDAVEAGDGTFIFDKTNGRSLEEGLDFFREEFIQFYQELDIEGSNQKVFVVLENLFPKTKGQACSIMCRYEEIYELFHSPSFQNSNVGLLLDLGHLAISANLLGFDKNKFIDSLLENFGDKIYEVHLSENNLNNDSHEVIAKDSWQVKALKLFRKTGERIGGTIFCIESRNLCDDRIKESHSLILSRLLR